MYFLYDRPKLESESVFNAKINDEAETGLAIAVRLLKTYLWRQKCVKRLEKILKYSQ